jgi:hypothetical protein
MITYILWGRAKWTVDLARGSVLCKCHHIHPVGKAKAINGLARESALFKASSHTNCRKAKAVRGSVERPDYASTITYTL